MHMLKLRRVKQVCNVAVRRWSHSANSWISTSCLSSFSFVESAPAHMRVVKTPKGKNAHLPPINMALEIPRASVAKLDYPFKHTSDLKQKHWKLLGVILVSAASSGYPELCFYVRCDQDLRGVQSLPWGQTPGVDLTNLHFGQKVYGQILSLDIWTKYLPTKKLQAKMYLIIMDKILSTR
jgi:hypothetical protein